MSQYLVHEKNELKEKTFEEICPRHTNILTNWDNLTIDQKIEEIRTVQQSTKKCFLGEAYGGFSSYPDYCDECRGHGSSLSGIPSAFSCTNLLFDNGKELKSATVDWRTFEEKKALFVEHWNKNHNNSRFQYEVEEFKDRYFAKTGNP